MTKLQIARRVLAFIIIGGSLYAGLRALEVNTSDTIFVLSIIVGLMFVAAVLWPSDEKPVKPIVGKRNSDIASAVALLISNEVKDVVCHPDGSIAVLYSNGIMFNYIPKQPVEFAAELKQSNVIFTNIVMGAAIVDLDARLNMLERKNNSNLGERVS